MCEICSPPQRSVLVTIPSCSSRAARTFVRMPPLQLLPNTEATGLCQESGKEHKYPSVREHFKGTDFVILWIITFTWAASLNGSGVTVVWNGHLTCIRLASGHAEEYWREIFPAHQEALFSLYMVWFSILSYSAAAGCLETHHLSLALHCLSFCSLTCLSLWYHSEHFD